MIPRLDQRFWASTRGRIILLLLPGSRTVNELAEAVGLTDNAIRAHLTSLERDGLVEQSGTRPGTRRPNATYTLAAEAQQLFPKVYGIILRHFLDVLKETASAKKLDEIVRAVGSRLAPSYRPANRAGPLPERIEHAIEMLRQLGGFCKSEAEDGHIVLRCFECPLAVAAMDHPEVCRLIETLLADILSTPVQQRCQTNPTPQCRFEIKTHLG
ncbi:MAG: helix-turn-helix transcriptional regulator [Gemmataceae bacterium]